MVTTSSSDVLVKCPFPLKTFMCVTCRQNPRFAHELKVNDWESLKTSSYDPKRLTKFIIHGYQDNANEISVGDWIIFMKNAYLQLGDVNVSTIYPNSFHS